MFKDFFLCPGDQDSVPVRESSQNNTVTEKPGALCQAEIISVNPPVHNGRVQILIAVKVNIALAYVQHIEIRGLFDVVIHHFLVGGHKFLKLFICKEIPLSSQGRIEDSLRAGLQGTI